MMPFVLMGRTKLPPESAPSDEDVYDDDRQLVGSRTGAVLRRFSLSVAPRFLWECLTSQTVNWFPAPAASNPSCRFPAMGLPACFESRVMRRFCLHLDI